LLCFLYGFAKINGSQFTVLDSELARPMGEVTGFWLTWHYFGFSPVYGTFLALVQIVCGVLLLAPRTALLGAVVLLPFAVNILLVDIFYGVDIGGTLAALALLVCVSSIAAPFASRLRSAVVLDTLPRRPSRSSLVGLVLAVPAAFALTWWVANFNKERHHFEVDSSGVVRVWRDWLRKGPLIMQGRLLSETEIELKSPESPSRGSLLLRRSERAPKR
jgi:hypothetical protein